jgi:hypothetical protein
MRKKLKGWSESELNQLLKSLLASDTKSKSAKKKSKK